MTDPIDWIATRIAHTAKEWDPSITRDTDDIRYGLAVNISFYAVIIISLLIGAVTGAFWGTVSTMAAAWMLRRLTGGRHLPTLTACLLFSVTVISLTPHMPDIDLYWLYGLIVVTLLIVARFTDYRKYLWVSFLLIGGNFILQSSSVALVFFIQALSLIQFKGGDTT